MAATEEDEDAIWSAVFGDTDEEAEREPVEVEEAVHQEGQWERIEQVPGLVVLRDFLSHTEQEALERVISEENWFPDEFHNQAMRFGELPRWAVSVSQRIREHASGVERWEPILSTILKREPLFDQMIVNSYQPGEGIKAHVDLLRFEDGIAIVSLVSACVMCFRKQQGDGESQAEAAKVLLMAGDLMVLCGEARYGWSHEINRKEEDGEQVWQGQRIRQERRLSVTLRRLCPQH